MSKSSNSNYKSKNSMISKTLTNNDKYNNNQLGNFSQYIKEQVKLFFIKNNFSSIKEFFNDWFIDNKNKLYLDTDSIFIYLKKRIGLKISKDDVNKIFVDTLSYLDIERFKNYFFEENSGKECFIITKDLLLKKAKSDFENVINKDNYLLFSPKSLFSKNKEKDFIFKYSLFFSALKDQKSILLDKICEYNPNNNNIEYNYNDFYNLINSLKIDKNILDSKIIKALFIKHQNKNKKLNIKYFINILYGNENIKKECFLNEKVINIKENTHNELQNIINIHQNNLETNKNNTITKVSPNNNNLNIRKNISNLNKKNINIIKNEIKPISNNNSIIINKNTENSSDNIDIIIKPKNKFAKNEVNKNNMIPECHKLKIMLNKSEEEISNLNKVINNNRTKLNKKKNKKLFSFQKDSNISNSKISKREIVNSNKKDKNNFKTIKNYNMKSKKEKKFKYNIFKTIKIKKKYKLNKENDNSKNGNKSIEKNKKIKRSLSSKLKRKKKNFEKIFRKNKSNLIKFEMSGISEISRIQYLNSDIIDLI